MHWHFSFQDPKPSPYRYRSAWFEQHIYQRDYYYRRDPLQSVRFQQVVHTGRDKFTFNGGEVPAMEKYHLRIRMSQACLFAVTARRP